MNSLILSKLADFTLQLKALRGEFITLEVRNSSIIYLNLPHHFSRKSYPRPNPHEFKLNTRIDATVCDEVCFCFIRRD